MSPRPRTLAIRQLLASLACAAVCACGSSYPDSLEVTALQSEGGKANTDLIFHLAKNETRPDGSRFLSATGVHRGITVGFDLELGPWRENPPGYVNMPTWDCKATLRSRGACSDAFLRVLDNVYATNFAPELMVESIELQGFTPWENLGQRTDGIAKFHLLFPNNFSVDRPGELRVWVDLDENRIVFREKEPGFRRGVVSALTASE